MDKNDSIHDLPLDQTPWKCWHPDHWLGTVALNCTPLGLHAERHAGSFAFAPSLGFEKDAAKYPEDVRP